MTLPRNVSTWYTPGRGFESFFGPHWADWESATPPEHGLDEYEIALKAKRLRGK